MARLIYCLKLKKKCEGLEWAPCPGELGEKVYQHISKEAWSSWLHHQTMLINEYRLTMIDPKARDFLTQEMEKFLFGAGSATPEGFRSVEK